MARTEKVELTALCLVHSEDAYLLQNRVKEEYEGEPISSEEGDMHWIKKENEKIYFGNHTWIGCRGTDFNQAKVFSDESEFSCKFKF